MYEWIFHLTTGAVTGWVWGGWILNWSRWLDRKHRARQQRLWDEGLDRAQEQTDKEYPR